jgi:hypothetical protein
MAGFGLRQNQFITRFLMFISNQNDRDVMRDKKGLTLTFNPWDFHHLLQSPLTPFIHPLGMARTIISLSLVCNSCCSSIFCLPVSLFLLLSSHSYTLLASCSATSTLYLNNAIMCSITNLKTYWYKGSQKQCVIAG